MFLFGQDREVLWQQDRDNGGMFASIVGVFKAPEGKFRGFLKDGWGGGVAGKHFDDPELAKKDTERLWNKYAY